MSHDANCAVFDPTPGACDCTAGQRDTATRWFHHLWTQAGNAPSYNKDTWRQAREQLVQAGVIDAK